MMRTWKPTGSSIAAICLFSTAGIAQPLQLTQQQFIAQQSTQEAAAASFIHGYKLFQEGTAESLQAAIPYLEKAATLFDQISDQTRQAITLLALGRTYNVLGEKQKALNYYKQALTLFQVVGDSPEERLRQRRGEASTLHNIGIVYYNLEEKQKALDSYKQAITLFQAVADRKGESAALNNIGLVYSDLGENQQALAYYNQALLLLKALDEHEQEATILNHIGNVYFVLGEKQQALNYYNQALPLRQVVGDRPGEATTLNNIGLVYSDLGEKQQALDYYKQALTLFQAVADRKGEAATLNNIGGIYFDLEEKQQSLDYHNQALLLIQAMGDQTEEATILNNIGRIYDDLGEKQKALNHYNQALLLSQTVSNRKQEAITLNNLGWIYFDLGEKQKALDYYNQALPLTQAVGDRKTEAINLSNIALTKSSLGNLTEAITDIQAAIEIVEDLRSKIGSQELRASYFATVQGYYKFYIELLMQLHQQDPNSGYDALALHISERSRARSLVELLTEANANIREDVDSQLLEKERNLLQQLNTVERDRHELVSGQYNQAELDRIKQKSQSLLTQLDQLEAQIRLTSPRYAELKYPRPLTLEQIQEKVLDQDTLLLTYSLGEDRSYLWAVTKDNITSYELPKQSEIEAAANTFRESVFFDNGADLSSGVPLSQILLAPVADQLQGKRLLIVGDGVLQYVPFAALPLPNSPTTPLLVQNEIVTLPSASTLAIQRQQLQNRSAAPKILAVLADPVFSEDDSRISGNSLQINAETSDYSALTLAMRNSEFGEEFDRLKFTRTEAEEILALVPENKQMKAFDFQANRQFATHPNLAQYQIIHFATHGLLDPVNPELSGVVLSLFNENGKTENGFLRLDDIFNLNLPAELVVLSACQTGLGEDIKGEGLVGLTRGFMYAGARRVVVSLWSVNDLATSELMAAYYQKMLNQQQDPVTALREAQLEMWNSQQWRSPYYWAAFTIQGDWL